MKYPMISIGVVCLCFILLPACAPQPEQPAEADVAAIKSVNQQCVTAINASDFDTMVGLHADDFIWYPPNEPALTGKDALREWLQSAFDKSEYDESWSSEEIVVFGDWAFDRGTFTATVTPKDGGESFQSNGKYIYILRRQSDGSWKYARSIWNSDNPPPGEPAT